MGTNIQLPHVNPISSKIGLVAATFTVGQPGKFGRSKLHKIIFISSTVGCASFHTVKCEGKRVSLTRSFKTNGHTLVHAPC